MGALSGMRVLDFSHVVSGPFATMLLGDLGAEVIKIEPPGGDLARQFGPPFAAGESSYFLAIGRNKRSVTLDLKQPGSRQVIERLLRDADVLVSNFRPGVMEKFGYGYDQLAPHYPRLVYCRISGYGEDGPWADYPAFDQVIQGMSGLMSVTGSPEAGFFRVGIPIADLLAALMALYGILGALVHRERSGEGQLVDVAMLDAVLPALTYQAGRYLTTGDDIKPEGNRHPLTAPFGAYRVSDGWVNICVSGDVIWRRLCTALGEPGLAAEQRFATQPLRVQNRQALDEELNRLLAGRRAQDVVDLLNGAGVPCGPIWTVGQVLESSYVRAKGLVTELQHARAGRIRTVGPAVKLSRTPAAIQGPPPVLGEHTDAVLAQLGFSEHEIEALRRDGTFGSPR